MDPHHNQRDMRQRLNSRGDTSPLPEGASGVSGKDPAPENVDTNVPESGNPPAANRQPRYSGGYTVIPPNETQRSKMKMMAQKEEEEFQRYKETHRVSSVHTDPERLGGNTTLAQAREKQLTALRHSKLQKKLKKEEQDKMRRQEEEEELQKKKAIQREKAERQVERKQQEEQGRREQFAQDHLRKNESFLQRVERTASVASSSATHTSSRREESKHGEKQSKSVKEVQQDHKRVNKAFLDKLEGQGRGSGKEIKKENVEEAERRCSDTEDFRQQTTTGHVNYLKPDPEQSCSGWTEEADSEPDYDWALMKLMNGFPECDKDFLEDILQQCNGDYEQARTLLMSTLS